MPFKPGDQVRFLNEEGEGTVVSVSDADDEVVVEVDGLEFTYPIGELIAVEGSKTIFTSQNEDNIPDINIGEPEYIPDTDLTAHSPKVTRKTLFKRANKKGVPEIDLHIHELLDSYAQMSNGEMLEYQIGYLSRVINCACDEYVRELIVIHGIGEGTLKNAVRDFLDAYQFIEYEDAPYNLYGYGATRVRIRGLNK